MGAAMLAAVGAGLFPNLEGAAAAMVARDRRFEPHAEGRAARREAWARALRQTVAA
jgi:glycerol kinase